MRTSYPTNLTESQYMAILAIIDDKRKRNHTLKEIFNAILYLLKTGCQWRMLPSEFPNWKLVYYYFSKWRDNGVFDQINRELHEKLRKQRDRDPSPSVGIIDSQSIRTTRVGGEARGWDGGKKLKGRKRHIVVDTQGHLLSIKVHTADKHDSKMGFKVLEAMKHDFRRMKKIYADGGYRGELIENVKNKLGYDMEITLRSDKNTEFKPLPKRWIVERTFSWFENFRRLAKDYEYSVKSSEAMITLAFIRLMLNNIIFK